MTHPIGFYASRPKGHPDYENLLKLEEFFGCCFQVLDVKELCTVLTICSLEVEGHYRNESAWNEVLPMIQRSDFWFPDVDKSRFKAIVNVVNLLTPETKLDLIPFVAEQIRNRPK